MGGTWRYLVMQLRNSNALKLGDIQCIKKQLPGELGFRNFIHCQEAFLLIVIDVDACLINVKEQAKNRQRARINRGLNDLVSHQVIQLFNHIDQTKLIDGFSA